jgi:hypothetical protein
MLKGLPEPIIEYALGGMSVTIMKSKKLENGGIYFDPYVWK